MSLVQVTDIKGNVIETFDDGSSHEVISKEIFVNTYFTNISINKYWDSHGKLCPWGKHTFKNKLVKIVKTITVDTFPFLEQPIESEHWSLEVDGKTINGNIREYIRQGDHIRIKLICGWG